MMGQEPESSTYWKLRLVVDALEKVVLSDDPKPGISPSTRTVMKQLLATASLRWNELGGNGCLTSKLEHADSVIPDGEFEKSALLDKWIKIEIKKLADEVVEVYRMRLNESEEPKDKELLHNLTASRNPLDLILDAISNDILEETQLDLEIEKWTKVRDSELESCTAEALQMNELIRNFRKDVTAGKYSKVTDEYFDFLKFEAEYLQNKLKLLEMQQKIAENPPEVTNDLEEAYERLLDARDKVENVISNLETKKSKYDSLGPEFQQMLLEWKEYGKLIESKKWVLNKLEKGDQSLDDSLNDSFAFDSPG